MRGAWEQLLNRRGESKAQVLVDQKLHAAGLDNRRSRVAAKASAA
jgi:hypothetical protein